MLTIATALLLSATLNPSCTTVPPMLYSEIVAAAELIVTGTATQSVCRIEEGECLERGQRIGLMKFGSRMDVFLPPSAELCVEPGQHVTAGETVIARLWNADVA